MNARQKRVRLIEQLAAKAFAGHVIDVQHDVGVYRHILCHRPRRSDYHFYITTFPGTLCVSGDVGELMVRRVKDMFDWAPGAAESIGYFAEKVVAGPTREYDQDVVREELEKLIAEGNESAREVLHGVDLSNPHVALMDVYESDLYDGCDFPTFENWHPRFLWCREAVRWFFRNYKPAERAPASSPEAAP